MQAGILRLGQIAHPNFNSNSDKLQLFLDNLFTYGSDYTNLKNSYQVQEPQKKRLNAIKQIKTIMNIL